MQSFLYAKFHNFVKKIATVASSLKIDI